ncbi:DoxX family protein [Geothrix sp. PMB-07]|uniref:DoxX family protein n=1 Tax=Geothrix sp. PMB-07 TaxID=3068640 RepID=UPI00274037EE|nr:DoxX family protein [Geothrix sp. PMB-07]WLT32250.1 DoxX family protein [Geothrix sp. PMB-07]
MQHPARGLAVIRVAVALLLLSHAVHALLHPEEIRGLGDLLSARHLPMGHGLAWSVVILQTLCSLALLAGRFMLPACLGHLLVLAVGIGLVHAPRWYVVGGASEPGHPGAEYSALLMACLLALLWAQVRRPQIGDGEIPSHQGLDLVRIAAAAVIAAHPLHGFAYPEGLPAFGQFLQGLGYPFGHQLVWLILLIQTACSLALLARRFVVPACLGHSFILAMGIQTVHAPHWFVVGPGENGMEFSLLLIACFISVLLAHWPREAKGR